MEGGGGMVGVVLLDLEVGGLEQATGAGFVDFGQEAEAEGTPFGAAAEGGEVHFFGDILEVVDAGDEQVIDGGRAGDLGVGQAAVTSEGGEVAAGDELKLTCVLECGEELAVEGLGDAAQGSLGAFGGVEKEGRGDIDRTDAEGLFLGGGKQREQGGDEEQAGAEKEARRAGGEPGRARWRREHGRQGTVTGGRCARAGAGRQREKTRRSVGGYSKHLEKRG